MKFSVFCLLAVDFAFSVLALAVVLHYCIRSSTLLHSLHYAVDTMTLRGRLPDPPDEELSHPVVFKVAEDVASVSVFVLLGFGLSVYVRAFEIIRLKSEFHGSGGGLPWQHWLRERNPETFDKYYGTGPEERSYWKRFKRWLHSV